MNFPSIQPSRVLRRSIIAARPLRPAPTGAVAARRQYRLARLRHYSRSAVRASPAGITRRGWRAASLRCDVAAANSKPRLLSGEHLDPAAEAARMAALAIGPGRAVDPAPAGAPRCAARPGCRLSNGVRCRPTGCHRAGSVDADLAIGILNPQHRGVAAGACSASTVALSGALEAARLACRQHTPARPAGSGGAGGGVTRSTTHSGVTQMWRGCRSATARCCWCATTRRDRSGVRDSDLVAIVPQMYAPSLAHRAVRVI